MKTYRAKTLFDGSVIGKIGKFVAIPGTDYPSKNNFTGLKKFQVEYQGQLMLIENWHQAQGYRKFDDQWGRGHYTLAYFEWIPQEVKNRSNQELAMEDMMR